MNKRRVTRYRARRPTLVTHICVACIRFRDTSDSQARPVPFKYYGQAALLFLSFFLYLFLFCFLFSVSGGAEAVSCSQKTRITTSKSGLIVRVVRQLAIGVTSSPRVL